MSVNALAGKATRIDSDKLKLVDGVSQYIFELLFNDLNQANTYYNNTIINSFDHDILNALNENLISLFLKAYENKRLTNDYKENLFQNLHELLNDEGKDSLTSKMLSFGTNESQTFVSYSKNEFNLKDRLKKNRGYPFAFTTAIYCIFSFTNNGESNAATLPTKTESISPKHNLKKNNTIEIKTDDFRGQTYVSNFLSAYNTIKNEELVLPSDSGVGRFTQVPGSVIENIKECIRKNETDFTIEIYTIGNYNSGDISGYSTYCYTGYELINSKSTLQQILEKCIKANNNGKYKKMQIIPKDLFIQIKEYYNLNGIEKTIKNFLINNEKTEIGENFNELKISFTIPNS